MKNQETMKAVICSKYGSPDILKLCEVIKPIPKDDEVLIRIFASSINAYDWHKLRADTFLVRLMGSGIIKPKKQILGCDIAGRVEVVGKNIMKFKIGDAVYGCMAGLGEGGYAEYVCAPERTLALIPANFTFEQAAAIPMAGVTALQGVKLGGVKERQSVLINGASGGVGLFSVQMAKALGAFVTGICSTKNIDLARSFGADEIIDYTKENFLENGKHYDVIIDIAASTSVKQFRNSLKSNGTCVVIGFKKTSVACVGYIFKIALKGKPKAKNENKRVVLLMAENTNSADLAELRVLIESGKIKPIIDTVYPLCETSKAFWHYEKEHAKGKIVIKITE